jgi:hypothetical protein
MVKRLNDEDLADVLKEGIGTGRITTIKREEEVRRVSRTKIRADKIYEWVARLGSQWVLIKKGME